MKKGDKVVIIAGKYKGKKGVIAKVDRENERVFVEGVSMGVRHYKKVQGRDKVGILPIMNSLHISNVKSAEPVQKK